MKTKEQIARELIDLFNNSIDRALHNNTIGEAYVIAWDKTATRVHEMIVEGRFAEVRGWMMDKKKLKLCRCNHGSTVKHINDDFFECPRYGGLIPRVKDIKSQCADELTEAMKLAGKNKLTWSIWNELDNLITSWRKGDKK